MLFYSDCRRSYRSKGIQSIRSLWWTESSNKKAWSCSCCLWRGCSSRRWIYSFPAFGISYWKISFGYLHGQFLDNSSNNISFISNIFLLPGIKLNYVSVWFFLSLIIYLVKYAINYNVFLFGNDELNFISSWKYTGTFTTNLMAAAPVLFCRKILEKSSTVCFLCNPSES